MKKIIVSLCGIMLAASGFTDSGPLTLAQALELARNNSPDLRASRMYSQAADKDVATAGLWTNPKLIFEAEGIGLDNDLFSQGEYTFALAQRFQLGGKQKKERAVALESVGVAGQALLEKELELIAEVRQAFVEVAAQQETGKVRAEQEQLGRALVEVARRRHKAGGGSELDVVLAELTLQELILEQTCCFGDLLAVQEKLASLIGIPVKELGELAAPYYELETLEGLVVDDNHPALKRLETDAEKVRAEARWAGAQDVPDVSLGAGYRYMAEDDSNTLLFFVAMPLSINRQGRAEQAAGMVRVDAVLAEREEARRKLQAELASLLALYNGSKVEVELMKNSLMTKAEQAYELSRAGYEAGRFSWLELIASQQHLADIRIRYIESLREAHLARAQISKFTKEGI